VKPSSIVLVVVLVLVLVPVTSTLWAIAQGDGFDIHACVNPAGQLRIVDDLSKCKNKETELEWSKQGPEAPPGPTGPLSFYLVRVAGQIPPGYHTVNADCYEGDEVLGGGFARCFPPYCPKEVMEDMLVLSSMPHNRYQGWQVKVWNPTDYEYADVEVYARCFDMSP
jgi:hypothetical protein